MKLMSLFLFFMSINLGLILINFSTNDSGFNQNTNVYPGGQLATYDPSNPDYNTNIETASGVTTNLQSGVSGYSSADLWNVFFFPGSGNSSRIIMYLVAFGLLIGALGFVPFVNRSDLSVLSGPFLILIAVGAPTAVNTYVFINKNVSAFACEIGQACLVSNIAGAMIGGTLMVAWIFASIEWWTGRPTGP